MMIRPTRRNRGSRSERITSGSTTHCPPAPMPGRRRRQRDRGTLSAGPQPVHSGSQSVLLKAKGLRQVVHPGHSAGSARWHRGQAVCLRLPGAENPPKEIMLQWNTGRREHRAYWGDEHHPLGPRQVAGAAYVGPLPKTGQWVRLEVDAAAVGLKPGAVITGWAFTQHDGTAYWDRAGIVTQTPQAEQPFDSLTAWVRVQRAAGGAGLPANVQAAVKLDACETYAVAAEGVARLLRCQRLVEDASAAGPVSEATGNHRAGTQAVGEQLPSTLVFRERKQPKPAYILKRGEYDQHGDKVERVTPTFLPPLPGTAAQPSRPGEVACVAGTSADGARGRQSLLAAVLRRRPCQDGGGLRLSGRAAEPSRVARLAGGAVPSTMAGTSSRR